MKRAFGWLLLALAFYLAALLATAPARLLLAWLPEQVRLVDVTGTLWSGRGGPVQVEKLRIERVEWDWRPSGLLLGRMAYRVRVKTLGGHAGFDMGVGPFSGVVLEDMQGAWPAASIGPLLPVKGIALGGRLELALERLVLEQGWPAEIEGSLHWRDAALVSPFSFELGSFQAVPALAEDGRLRLDISDDGGALDADGEAVLSPDHRYRLDLRIRARASAAPGLADSLKLLGNPDARGFYRLQLSGRF